VKPEKGIHSIRASTPISRKNNGFKDNMYVTLLSRENTFRGTTTAAAGQKERKARTTLAWKSEYCHRRGKE